MSLSVCVASNTSLSNHRERKNVTVSLTNWSETYIYAERRQNVSTKPDRHNNAMKQMEISNTVLDLHQVPQDTASTRPNDLKHSR